MSARHCASPRGGSCTDGGVRYAAAIPAVALVAGCGCGLLLSDPPTLVASIALTLSVVVAIGALIRGRSRAVGAAVAFGFAIGGAWLSAVEWQRAWRPPLRVAFERCARQQRAAAVADGRRPAEDDEALVTIAGTLRADAALTENGVSLSVDVEEIEDPAAGLAEARREFGRAKAGGIAVTVVGALALERVGDWRAGRRVRMPVLLRRPPRYLDPGVPDHERELARRGTTLVGTVKSGALVDVIARGGWWSERLAAARAFARRAIDDSVGRWSARSAAIVAAIVIGDRSRLDAEVQTALQEAGTYHVIAISGGNIAILAGLLLGAFRIAGWFGRGAMVSAIALIVAYARLVGGGSSVDRATLMAVVHFGARALDQRSPPLNGLAVVAALLVASNPLIVVDPAFLLTFGATLAILIVVPVFNARRLPRGVDWLWTMLVASAAAEVLLMPIGALSFSRVTLAGLALNALAIPLMGLAQVAGMAVVGVTAVAPLLAPAVGWMAHAGADGLVRSASLVRLAPALEWRVAPPSLWICAIYYLSLTLSWVAWRHRVRISGSAETAAARRVRIASAAVAVLAGCWIALDPRTLVAARGDGRLHVTVLDVGQGDAIFVVFPRGSTLLVDAGGLGFASSFDIGDRVVAPAIRAAGFRRIDRLALTHGDPDHIGGALSIVRELRPREIWEGIPVPRSEALTRLRVEAQGRGARWSNVFANDHVTIDDVAITAHHPERPDWERQKVRNDDSLVLELRWREVSVVLTGDVGRVAEQQLVSRIEPARLRVVKVPHHGSLTSSTPRFVEALRPTIAIASAGRSNHFGHPVPEVLERYAAVGARVFRTDRDGAVTIETDGEIVGVSTFVGAQRAQR